MSSAASKLNATDSCLELQTGLKSSKDVSWYVAGEPRLPDKTKALFESWSQFNATDERIEEHVLLVRDEAWNIHQYPCIGGYRFLFLGLAEHPAFNEVLVALEPSSPVHPQTLVPNLSNPIFVDLGCCMGQDIRYLANAGVKDDQLVGIDFEPTFFDLGYKLFRDRERLGARFIAADIFDLQDEQRPEACNGHALDPLVGRVSVLWASAFLHLWNWDGQVECCRKILRLMRNVPGTLILGRTAGSPQSGEIQHITNKSGLMFRHNPRSFFEMWATVLGCDGQIEGTHLLRSAENGTWEVSSFFEEDGAPSTDVMSDSAPLSDWLSKVVEDASAGASTPNQVLNDATAESVSKTQFLIWKLKRIE